MSNLSRLYDALKGSSAITNVVADRIFLTFVPEAQTRPYIVYFIATAVPENTLSEPPQVDDQRVQIDAYVPQTTGTAAANALKDAIIDAIEPIGHVVFGPWNAYESDTRLLRWSMDLEYWNFR
jgi:RimJ/RimL family protein N-acetyltransferase